jgi:hypothetical protein
MGELIELIIRVIEALGGGDNKKNAPSAVDWQAQQAEWERQRREWEAAQQQVQPPPAIATSAGQKGKKRSKGSGGRTAGAPPIKPVRTLAAELAESTQRVDAPRRSPVRSAAGARSIAQWARPGTLRSQFILTEVLKPPLCVREPKD